MAKTVLTTTVAAGDTVKNVLANSNFQFADNPGDIGVNVRVSVVCDTADNEFRLNTPMTSIEVGRPGQWAILSRLLWLGALPLIGTRFLPGTGPYRPRGRGTDNPLTSDATRASIMRRYIASTPGLALGGPTVRWLAASRDAMARITDKNAPPIDTEILIVSSSEDRVVGIRTQLILHEECLTNSRIEIIDGARHEILMEQDRYRQRFWDLFDDFVLGAAS